LHCFFTKSQVWRNKKKLFLYNYIHRVTLPRWRTGTFVWLFWSTIFFHNVINGWSQISKIPNYFRWWSSSAKAFDNYGSSIIFFDYILYLMSTPRPFWVYDCLLEAGLLNGQEWRLAEAQYGGKFKSKFVRILMMHWWPYNYISLLGLLTRTSIVFRHVPQA